MGKFINKEYANTIDSLSSGMIEKVKNANYVFNNKSPVICDWYNIDKDATTVGEESGLYYSNIGKTSPFKRNLIKDAIFYAQGIQINMDLEYDEEGLTIAPHTISGIVLPNTWIPYQDDYFFLKQSGKDYLYRVNSVGYDTIDNGNNVYSFEASIDQTGETDIDLSINDTYRMIINNVGTGYNAIVKEMVYDCIDTIDSILSLLKDNYIALFYNDAVQTFTYQGPYGKLYDPYMIEFMIRNDIIKGSREYIYVHHEVPVPRTFSIEYNNTIYRGLETIDKKYWSVSPAIAKAIDNPYSLFSSVVDTYFQISYSNTIIGHGAFSPIPGELLAKIKSGEEYDKEDKNTYMNIIIRYMNNKSIDSDILPLLEGIQFTPSVDLFYCIPMIIYSLEESVKKLLS